MQMDSDPSFECGVFEENHLVAKQWGVFAFALQDQFEGIPFLNFTTSRHKMKPNGILLQTLPPNRWEYRYALKEFQYNHPMLQESAVSCRHILPLSLPPWLKFAGVSSAALWT